MSDLTKLLGSAGHRGGIDRRSFLAAGAALAALPWLPGRSPAVASGRMAFADDPFALGVASGDPTSTGVVLWTRLAPRPLEPGGGLPPEGIEVGWEIASDDAMKDVVRRGTSVATPQLGHSVHVEAEGLLPDRWYYYRFRAGDAESPIGRARTLPDPRASPTCSASPSPPARTTSRACSPPTSTWPRTSSTWSSTWATTSTNTAGAIISGPQAPGREIMTPGRLPDPPRPVPRRPAPPGRPRPMPLDRDLGRPRGRQQLRRRRLRADRRRPGRLPGPAGQRLPGLLRDDAPAGRSSIPRGPDMQLYRKASYRPARRADDPRHPPVPDRPAQRRPERRPERGRPRPQEHPARPTSRKAGSRPRCWDRRGPGTSWPSR